MVYQNEGKIPPGYREEGREPGEFGWSHEVGARGDPMRVSGKRHSEYLCIFIGGNWMESSGKRHPGKPCILIGR